jgi:hypothetical protein
VPASYFAPGYPSRSPSSASATSSPQYSSPGWTLSLQYHLSNRRCVSCPLP